MQSLLAILMVAVRKPEAEGSNVTWKVVALAAATDEEGGVVSVKSEAFVPVIVTPVTLSVALPVFSMVNVRTTVPVQVSTLPKSLWSEVVGVGSPSRIVVLLPFTLISAIGDAAQLLPVVTPPGATQLELPPVSVKFVRVPFRPLPEASVSDVTPALLLKITP